jgi:hypothetical protein
MVHGVEVTTISNSSSPTLTNVNLHSRTPVSGRADRCAHRPALELTASNVEQTGLSQSDQNRHRFSVLHLVSWDQIFRSDHGAGPETAGDAPRRRALHC